MQQRQPMYRKSIFLAWKEARTMIGGWDGPAYDLYSDYERWVMEDRERLAPAPLGIWSMWMQARHERMSYDAVNVKGELRKVWYRGIRLKPDPAAEQEHGKIP